MLATDSIQAWILNGGVSSQKELETAIYWNSTDILAMDLNNNVLRHMYSDAIVENIDEDGYLIDSKSRVVFGWSDVIRV